MSILPDTQAIGYAAAFVAGVAGSVHCLAMCGGLSGALGMRARQRGVSPQKSFMYAAASQLGRLSSYALAGGLCGAFGGFFTQAFALTPLIQMLRMAAGLLLIALALKILLQWNLLRWLERAGGLFWQRIAPFSQRISGGGLKQSLLLGALWGWLPCGLVYSMLVFAAFSGRSLSGAGILLAFGVGTLPTMLTGSLLASQLTRLALGRKLRFGAGLLLLVFGLWTAVAPLQHGGHAAQVEHSEHAGHAM